MTMARNDTFEVQLPLMQLNPRLLFLPGIVYRTSFTHEQAVAILARFSSILKDTDFNHREVVQDALLKGGKSSISQSSLDGCQSVKKKLSVESDENPWLVLVCLPGSTVTGDETVGTVCSIVDISERSNEVTISFKALSRGLLRPAKSDPQNESKVVVEFRAGSKLPTKDLRKTLTNCLRLLGNVQSFSKQYRDASKAFGDLDDDERLKNVMLVLTPLASVLYDQLSSQEMSQSFVRLNRMFKGLDSEFASMSSTEQAVRLLQLVDILTAVFPFTATHKNRVLSSFSQSLSRLDAANEAIDFGNKIFEETLNMNYLVETWKSLDVRSSPRRAATTKSRFISNHLRSLKLLLEEINDARPKGSNKGPLRPRDTNEDDDSDLVSVFVKNIDNLDLPEDGKKLILKDFKRLSSMQQSSSEYQVIRSYLEIVADIPWTKFDAARNYSAIDLENAKSQLDSDHFGLNSVKERILEYLAVLSLHSRLEDVSSAKSKDSANSISIGDPDTKAPSPLALSKKRPRSTVKSPILLLTGPPGVGKTSLAKSIATALGRNFQRISLGGLRDESEIKGHRRTYLGSLPGMLVQALRKAQTMNPVILLDEIDKVVGGSAESAARAHGDPAAALLEVLDPEQNVNFHDHYIGFPIDLSQVVFICTSNDLYRLSDPLRDRMEVIELGGYSYMEKVEICKRYLVPKQLKRNGLPLETKSGDSYLQISDKAILKIAVEYTREAGIRSLERMVGSVCRGKAIELSRLIKNSDDLKEFPPGYNPVVSENDLAKYIGLSPRSSENGTAESGITPNYGVVNGLSYNSDGSGGLLVFEMNGVEGGSQALTTTGRLGNVLVESIKIANTIVKSVLNNHLLYSKSGEGIETSRLLKRFNSLDAHLHVPQGAISKDGPSAGITITLCLLSLVLQKEVPTDVAMTGEIDLRGLVLPIGGVREKLLGAHLSKKVSKVLLPRANRKDVTESYLYSISGEDGSDDVLSRLIQEEENSVKSSDKHTRLTVFSDPERWVKDTLKIEISYVEEFSDVVNAVWGQEISLHLTPDSIKSEEKVVSHL
ncbi:unnamed protein product [Kuraishia capsulata CBS 1993]|uniref:Lon protease homolog 2, peroxisomal n=1 Tax=Kuraishia capsulata CBS 1993 TaxID=1382522 RepID=W6MP77_9ASCO|nr:uncharacterized protein KUCA_T00004423001 [Kuraishia capsulata CBS 1993]CDK28441.1 unnamed protein product [Kuraishia capsulata CBS 1993]